MRALAVTALIAGALIRIAILPIGVPAIDDSWRAWSYHAAIDGPWNLYGPKGHTVSFGGIEAPVVHPPLALDEFAILGRARLARTGGRFENDLALTKTIKSAIVLLDGALTALLFLAVRRAGGAARDWWAAMAYWVNPAVLMATTLGYVDVFLAIPAVGAVVAASFGRPWLSGALFAAAVMTKPQGLFVAPAVALALWNAGAAETGATRLRQAVAASALVAAVVASPVAVGKTYDMLRSIAVLAGHDMLSALAFNLWWVVSYLFTVAAARAGGSRAPLRVPTDIITHAYAMTHGFPNPRLIALVLLAAPVLWALRTAIRARDLGLQSALAAFIVVASFTLSVQVHENHFFLVIPLLALAAALRREFVPVLAALSVTWALNLYVVYGLHGEGTADFAGVSRIDPTVLLSAVNCLVFAWFGPVFARACRGIPSPAGAPLVAT